jgi:hypothetical protein
MQMIFCTIVNCIAISHMASGLVCLTKDLTHTFKNELITFAHFQSNVTQLAMQVENMQATKIGFTATPVSVDLNCANSTQTSSSIRYGKISLDAASWCNITKCCKDANASVCYKDGSTAIACYWPADTDTENASAKYLQFTNVTASSNFQTISLNNVTKFWKYNDIEKTPNDIMHFYILEGT